MTVQRLIEELSQYPQDMEVTYPDGLDTTTPSKLREITYYRSIGNGNFEVIKRLEII